MNEEQIRAKYQEIDRKADREFAAVLLKDIPYFHKLYAKYHHPESLEIAKNLGIALDKVYKKHEVDNQPITQPI